MNSAVLIPRQETELLVQMALSWTGGKEHLEIIDVGTGSGCIAVTLALLLPEATISAGDISENALAVARDNAARHCVSDRIHFFHAPFLESISRKYDLVIANLPYVTDHEWTALDVGVKLYEPEIALRGGPDGLAHIRNLLQETAEQLAPGGAIFLEIGWSQGQDVLDIAQSCFPQAEVNVHQDLAGLDRIVSITT